MINFDFLVAGCNTRCRHCYVNGGPGPIMPITDVLLCMEKMDAMAAYLPSDTAFTLDHEPINHPHLDRILYAASHTRHIRNYHHGMTTGVGLMARPDRDAVIRSYLDCGYDDFGITVHGSEEHHDEIVRRKGAYAAAVAAAAYAKAQGAKINVSLMLNRFYSEDAKAISAMLEQLWPDSIYFAVPLFTPHRNMLEFEPYRACVKTVKALCGYLTEWRQDETEIVRAAQRNTAACARERLRQGDDLPALFAQRQEELYLTVHQDCRLYVGNSGAETCCLGDLRRLDLKATAARIQSLPGNRDYTAFYDVTVLPSVEKLLAAWADLPQDTLYGDFESVVYRGLTALRIPTKILDLSLHPYPQ